MLAAEVSTKINQRVRELWEAGIPGPVMRTTVNREFGIALHQSAYHDRVRRLGLKWRGGAHPTKAESATIEMVLAEASGENPSTLKEIQTRLQQATGKDWPLSSIRRRLRRAGLKWARCHRAPVRGFLPEEERPSCYQDPAYEARNNMPDRLVCRECFGVFRDLQAHLHRFHQMDTREYRKRHPEVRTVSFHRIARGRECQDLMREFAQRYSTPSERAAAAADREYEDKNCISEYVICRIPRCGFRCTHYLRDHLKKDHGIAVPEYRGTYNWPPIFSKDFLAKEHKGQLRRKENRENLQREFELALAEAAKRGKPGPDPDDKTGAMVDHLYTHGYTWDAIKDEVDKTGVHLTKDALQMKRKRYLQRKAKGLTSVQPTN